jgi:hypothetical protein
VTNPEMYLIYRALFLVPIGFDEDSVLLDYDVALIGK